MDRYTYKDELYKRLEVAFPNLNFWKIKRIAEDIINDKSNDPSIVHKRGTQRTIVESWEQIEEWLWDEMGGNDRDTKLSEVVFEEALKETKEKYEPYWKKVITIYANN